MESLGTDSDVFNSYQKTSITGHGDVQPRKLILISKIVMFVKELPFPNHLFLKFWSVNFGPHADHVVNVQIVSCLTCTPVRQNLAKL